VSNEQQEERNLPVPTEEPARDRNSLGEAWREVGEQFQQLGSRLADAIRKGWQSGAQEQESEESMRRLRDDLRAAADRVDGAIKQAKDETSEERRSTYAATRKASEQSLDEARVLTASTLRKLNEQLERLARRLEKDQQDDVEDTRDQG
jgi:hypothetical protein